MELMPIYEYQAKTPSKGCSVCREGFEYIQNIDEDPLARCPNCGGEIRRVISWCHAAMVDSSPEHTATEQKITEYEREGLYSHAAELADTYSHKTKDRLLKERALEDYKKAGYKFDWTPGEDSL
jgi:putative FmdB family regulatory protein